MRVRVGITIIALLGLASCSSDSQVSPASATPPERVLRVTLMQGETLSGPYSGTVTSPSGFACSLGVNEQSKSCLAARFSDGQVITLNVTLLNPVPGDRPIWRTLGCDSVTDSTCTLRMTADKSVTISIGCAACLG